MTLQIRPFKDSKIIDCGGDRSPSAVTNLPPEATPGATPEKRIAMTTTARYSEVRKLLDRLKIPEDQTIDFTVVAGAMGLEQDLFVTESAVLATTDESGNPNVSRSILAFRDAKEFNIARSFDFEVQIGNKLVRLKAHPQVLPDESHTYLITTPEEGADVEEESETDKASH